MVSRGRIHSSIGIVKRNEVIMGEKNRRLSSFSGVRFYHTRPNVGEKIQRAGSKRFLQ